MNRIPITIENIEAGDIVKLRNGCEFKITHVSDDLNDNYPIEHSGDMRFLCWTTKGRNYNDRQESEMDIVEAWRESGTPIEVTAIVPDDGIPEPVKSLARRLAATDGISPDALTLIGETMKGGIVTILHSIELQPAWMRYVIPASQIIEQVLQDQGDGWFPIDTLDTVATRHAAFWVVDGETEYLIADAYYSEAGVWESCAMGVNETIPVSMLGGKVTHYRNLPKRPVDMDKPKT